MLADDDFGGAPANVHHQTPLRRWRQQAGDAAIDQPGLFLARDDFDGKAQQGAASRDEDIAVAGLAQGLRGHGADLVGRKAGQPFAKACQAVPAALHGFVSQFMALVESIALAHGFLEVFHALYALVAADAAYFEAKAVGPEVNGSEQGFWCHERNANQDSSSTIAQRCPRGQGCTCLVPARATHKTKTEL